MGTYGASTRWFTVNASSLNCENDSVECCRDRNINEADVEDAPASRWNPFARPCANRRDSHVVVTR